MEDESIKTKKEEEIRRSTSSRYSELLGLHEKRMPKSTAELPTTISLPPEILGNLEEAILDMEEDGLERYQFINWDSKKDMFVPSKLWIGNQSSIGKDAATTRYSKLMLGEKAIFEYHTHPYGDFLFSSHDLSGDLANPRNALIRVVGSSKGISFLFQTKKSARLPISSALKHRLTVKELKKTNTESLLTVAAYLRQKEYEYYIWAPPNERELKQGDLKNGITIEKVIGRIEVISL